MHRSKVKPKRARGGGVWKRIGFTLLVLALVAGLVGVGGAIYLYQTTKLPDPNADFQTNTTFITYADGQTKLGSLAVQNRETLTYDEMPQVVKDAVIAAEDRSFWTNPGFSAPGIARAAWSIATGGEVQGGSTITQQYIKILYLTSDRTMQRKVRELMLSIKMGKEQPKEEVLAGYLNTIYFGRGAYGVQAAAKSYFLKPVKDLSVAEAASLAAILNNPAGFNPSGGETKRARLLARYRYVLDGMREMGTITAAQHDEAYPQLPKFPEVPVNNRYGGTKGYLLKMVEEELEEAGIPAEKIHGGGLRITTTIDKPLQDQAVKVAQEYTKRAAERGKDGAKAEDLHISIASVDTATGAIRAVYGGSDYAKYPRNWATTPRAAASTFKTFAVIAGLRDGFSLRDRFNGNTFLPEHDTKEIHNQNDEEYGRVTLRRALAKSINTAFVDLTQQMSDGPKKIIQAANDAGAPTGPGWDAHNRIALGFGEVSPVNIANSYATLANEGRRNPAHVVQEVTDAKGSVIYQAPHPNEQSVEPDIAAQVVDALTSVVDEGTGVRAGRLRRPVAGKTGTNGVDKKITSAWFVGTTKQVSTAVNFVAGDGAGDLVAYKRPGDRTFYGSGYPLEVWLDYMEVAVKGMPVEDFAQASSKERTRTKEPEPEPSRESSSTEEATGGEAPTETASATPSEPPTPSPEPTSEPTPSQEPTTEPPPPGPTANTPEPSPKPRPSTSSPTPKPTKSSPRPKPTPTKHPDKPGGGGQHDEGGAA